VHDPLIEVAQTVADTIMAIAGPLFWGVLVIGLLTSLFR
jgi:flagellar biosynthesis protein FliQ